MATLAQSFKTISRASAKASKALDRALKPVVPVFAICGAILIADAFVSVRRETAAATEAIDSLSRQVLAANCDKKAIFAVSAPYSSTPLIGIADWLSSKIGIIPDTQGTLQVRGIRTGTYLTRDGIETPKVTAFFGKQGYNSGRPLPFPERDAAKCHGMWAAEKPTNG